LVGKFALKRKLPGTLAAVSAAAVFVFAPTTPTHAFSWPDPWTGPWIAPWGLPLPIVWGLPLLPAADAAPTNGTASAAASPTTAIPGTYSEPFGAQVRSAWLQAQVLQAINRGDAAAAGVYLADDAVYSISDGIGLCGPIPCLGRLAIQPELDRQVSVHVSYIPVGVDATANTVTGHYAITSDNITAAGAQRVLGTVTSETRSDKLSYVRLSLERDDPQTATYLAWAMRQPGGAGLAPAATAPAPTGGAAPSTGTAPAGGAAAPTAGAATMAPGAVARGSSTLAATLNSGVTGSATLAQSGETTSVTVTLGGMAPNSAHVGHIHRGSCSGAIIFPLGVITADASGQGSVTATVNASIDAPSWWIQFHTGDNPPGPPIACGPVTLGS
jgi:hypothetical protein